MRIRVVFCQRPGTFLRQEFIWRAIWHELALRPNSRFMKKVLAELLTIGDEILYGQIVDTNAQWMSTELDNVGIKVIRKTSVGDNVDEIMTAFAEAEQRADIIL